MKNWYLLLFVMAFVFASCGRSAIKFNDELAKIENSLEGVSKKAGEDLDRFYKDNQKDSLKAVATKMEKLLESKIQEVEKLEVPSAKKAAEMKTSFLAYFNFFKNYFKQWSVMADTKSDDEETAQAEAIEKLNNQIDDQVKMIQTAQKEFGDANGFKIKSN